MLKFQISSGGGTLIDGQCIHKGALVIFTVDEQVTVVLTRLSTSFSTDLCLKALKH